MIDQSLHLGAIQQQVIGNATVMVGTFLLVTKDTAEESDIHGRGKLHL
jgi:hypothetical protein